MAMGGSDEFSALLVSLRQVAMVTARVLLARPANQVPAGNAHLSGAVLPNVRAFPVVSLMTLESFRGETLGWFSSPMPSCVAHAAWHWKFSRRYCSGNCSGETSANRVLAAYPLRFGSPLTILLE
jgi:hypothetical protein